MVSIHKTFDRPFHYLSKCMVREINKYQIRMLLPPPLYESYLNSLMNKILYLYLFLYIISSYVIGLSLALKKWQLPMLVNWQIHTSCRSESSNYKLGRLDKLLDLSADPLWSLDSENFWPFHHLDKCYMGDINGYHRRMLVHPAPPLHMDHCKIVE